METTLPDTSARVPLNTAAKANQKIEQQTLERIERSAREPEHAEARLRELDREWDVERVLELNASLLALTGVALGASVDRRWLWLSAAVCGFLAQHAVQGWCPPLPILRRLGVRTQREIEVERQAIKLLRGDYRELSNGGAQADPVAVHAAVRRS